MSIKVLVADDSITIQKVIGIIFGGDEYSLTVVDNGKAAVEKAREINPDILLIDALMPGMTGYEVAEQVRLTPALASKPILILTGSFEPFDEEKAKKSGADDFIAKPFESQQIISKVKELLELGNSRGQSAPSAPEVPVTDVDIDTPPVDSTPEFDSLIPDETPHVETSEAPADIWGAFTPEVEPPAVEPAAPVFNVSEETAAEPDLFAIVSEENESEIIQTTAPANVSPQHTGTQWVPVEENTFEFEDETIVEPPQTSISEQQTPAQETAFGDISFESDSTVQSDTSVDDAPAVAFEDESISEEIFGTPVAPLEPFAPLADPAPAFIPVVTASIATSSDPTTETAPLALTEEQLRAAITSASREVIERIVWEVVPDLAEVLIKEAIRKVKEGA
jgi:CheY-like chemotaxis protein